MKRNVRVMPPSEVRLSTNESGTPVLRRCAGRVRGCEHQARRPRTDPAGGNSPGNPGENQLLPDTVAELKRLGLSPREVALDGGVHTGPTNEVRSAACARAGVHLRPPTTRLQTHPTPTAVLPNRRPRGDAMAALLEYRVPDGGPTLLEQIFRLE